MEPEIIIQFHIEERTITRDFKKTVGTIIPLPHLQEIQMEQKYLGSNGCTSTA